MKPIVKKMWTCDRWRELDYSLLQDGYSLEANGHVCKDCDYRNDKVPDCPYGTHRKPRPITITITEGHGEGR